MDLKRCFKFLSETTVVSASCVGNFFLGTAERKGGRKERKGDKETKRIEIRMGQ